MNDHEKRMSDETFRLKEEVAKLKEQSAELDIQLAQINKENEEARKEIDGLKDKIIATYERMLNKDTNPFSKMFDAMVKDEFAKGGSTKDTPTTVVNRKGPGL